MSKETRKFEIAIKETITTTHKIEIPVSFLDEQLKEYIGNKELYEDHLPDTVHRHFDEFVEYPKYRSKTIIDINFGCDTHISVEEIS